MNTKNYILEESYRSFINKFKKLQEEKKYWVEEKRIAAELGDRSENDEYVSAKNEIRRVENLLIKYQNIIDQSIIININENIKNNKVRFGSKVELVNIDTEEKLLFQIVGTNELELNKKFISNISPMGKEIMNLEIGDDFVVNNNEYEILDII